MAQEGDTITYTYSDGKSVAEDVSNVDEVVVDYCDAPGGNSGQTSGGAGGRVENATIDTSNKDTLYIWVGGIPDGRYDGETPLDGGYAGGTSEISFSNTDSTDSNDEPFVVAAGGGAGGTGESAFTGDAERGGDGARGGDGLSSGVTPPDGGDGVADLSTPGGDGAGAIDDQNRGLVSGGTTTTGGGSPSDTAGEIQISYGLPLESVQDISLSINGANVELDWTSTQDVGTLEVQRSTDGFQTVETVESGLLANASSFVDRAPQRSQQVEYRVVRQRENNTAESASLQVELPTFAEIANPGIGKKNKPRFDAVGVPSSASSVRFYRAIGQQPVFPDDYTLLEESSTKISDFEDLEVPNDQYVTYAFTSVDSNGNESDPDIRQTFVPPQDATVVNMDEDT